MNGDELFAPGQLAAYQDELSRAFELVATVIAVLLVVAALPLLFLAGPVVSLSSVFASACLRLYAVAVRARFGSKQ